MFLSVVRGSDVSQVLQTQQLSYLQHNERTQTTNCTAAVRSVPDPTGQTWGTPPLGLYCQDQGVPSPGTRLALYSGKEEKLLLYNKIQRNKETGMFLPRHYHCLHDVVGPGELPRPLASRHALPVLVDEWYDILQRDVHQHTLFISMQLVTLLQ